MPTECENVIFSFSLSVQRGEWERQSQTPFLSSLHTHSSYGRRTNGTDRGKKKKKKKQFAIKWEKRGCGVARPVPMRFGGGLFLAHHKDASGAARLFSVKAK